MVHHQVNIASALWLACATWLVLPLMASVPGRTAVLHIDTIRHDPVLPPFQLSPAPLSLPLSSPLSALSVSRPLSHALS